MAFIQGLVLEQDSNVYMNSDGSYGLLAQIPTPVSGGRVNGDYWAIPVLGQGVVGKGFFYKPCQPYDTVKPDVQAFKVIQLQVDNQQTTYFVCGISTQYSNASYDAETGHSATPVLMPTTVYQVLPSQVINTQNRSGLYFAMLAAPTLLSGQNYYGKGYLNGVALPALSATGYATAALLLSAMNSLWSAVGTWSYSVSDNITFQAVQSAGTGTDVLIAAISVA